MDKKLEYITLRDEFCEKLAPCNLDTELKAWNFYIDSTEEKKNLYLEAENVTHSLFQSSLSGIVFQTMSHRATEGGLFRHFQAR